jgi:hypothetical protein
LEWTHTSFEQSLAEFYTILLEEHLQVTLELLEVGICSSLLVSKTDYSGSMMFKSGDCAAQGRCQSSPSFLQTITEQFQLCERGHCQLGKLHHCSEIMSGSWDAPLYNRPEVAAVPRDLVPPHQ